MKIRNTTECTRQLVLDIFLLALYSAALLIDNTDNGLAPRVFSTVARNYWTDPRAILIMYEENWIRLYFKWSIKTTL